MKTKLVNRVRQTADRHDLLQTGIEAELRVRATSVLSPGILSTADVNTNTSPCALAVNGVDATKLDVLPGTVVFPNGEIMSVGASDVVSKDVDLSETETQIVRFEYGEISDGPVTTNPYTDFGTNPVRRAKTPSEALIIETAAEYEAQPQSVKDISVVLGAVSVSAGVLSVDNSRDTFSYSRLWASPVDWQHRSKVGTGVVTDTNPHGTTANDLVFGTMTVIQSLLGAPARVISPPQSVGRVSGRLCEETIPATGWSLDTTGLVTGVASARYAPLGYWPHQLTKAVDASSNAMACWIPVGRKVVAISDATFVNGSTVVTVNYTTVDAAAMPGSLGGSSLSLTQPNENELVLAGGNAFSELSEAEVVFTDVGLVPMAFDVLVDSTGAAYKRPDVIYCNTKLSSLGSSPVALTIQPRVPTRLRVAISNYVPGMTEVRFQITGTDEDGGALTEQVVFTGPLPSPSIAYAEVEEHRLFTDGIFASVTQFQVLVRNGDGPNTTVTVFAEHVPERRGTADDLLVGTVLWTGSEITDLYPLSDGVALDRRLVTRGGPLGADNGATNLGMLAESAPPSYFPATTTGWVTIAEDFDDPKFVEYPVNDFLSYPVDLPSDRRSVRYGYVSYKVPFGFTTTGAVQTAWARWIPRHRTLNPIRGMFMQLVLHRSGGADVVLNGSNTRASPPFQIDFGGGTIPSGSYYAATVRVYAAQPSTTADVVRGFVFQLRD